MSNRIAHVYRFFKDCSIACSAAYKFCADCLIIILLRMSLFTQRAINAGGAASSFRDGSKNRGSLASFANSVWSPSAGSVGRREESYHLLLELSSQEPTMQCCFKIIESTCLARGIDMEIRGKPPSQEFRTFVSRLAEPVPFSDGPPCCETRA